MNPMGVGAIHAVPANKVNEGTEIRQTMPATITAALFSPYYPAHGGGLELACEDLARMLTVVGISVEWSSQRTGAVPDLDEVQCTPLPGTDVIYSLSGVPFPIPAPWNLSKISKVVRRADVVIIAEANFILSVVAFLIGKWHRKPILIVQHVGEPSTVSKLARLIMRIGERVAVRPMLRRANGVVCVSPVVARHFGDLPQERFHTIGHSIDVDLFRPPIDERERFSDQNRLNLGHGKIACFAGRLTRSKGIEIMAEIAARRPDWTFAIAGIGPIDPSTWKLDNIVVLGQLDREDMARLFRASDVMILPSPSESFSLVVREAMASGCGVLCSPQIVETDPGIAPHIETETVDIDDAEATAAGFAAALDRNSGRSTNTARAYVIEQCAPDVVRRRYADLVIRLGPNGEGIIR